MKGVRKPWCTIIHPKVTQVWVKHASQCCLHIQGCPDMFWHSPGSPQPLFRILKWRGGTSWHRSSGCQTCFRFLHPQALNIYHIPTQTRTRYAAVLYRNGNNITPTFFPQHSLPDNRTFTIFRPGLSQLSALRRVLRINPWRRPRFDSSRKRNLNSQKKMRQNWAMQCFLTSSVLVNTFTKMCNSNNIFLDAMMKVQFKGLLSRSLN